MPVSIFFFVQKKTFSQANFGSKTRITLYLDSTFGAIPNDGIDDSYSLIKAAKYLENKWHANGDTLLPTDPPNIDYTNYYVRLVIPSGTIDVAEEISLMPGSTYDTFFVNSVINPGVKRLTYSTLFSNAGNNKEGIDILPVYDACAGKYRTKCYYPMPLFYVENPSVTASNIIDGIEIVGSGHNTIFRYADSLHFGFIDTNGNSYNLLSTSSCGYYWELNHSAYTLFSFSNCNNIRIAKFDIEGNNVNSIYKGLGIDGYQVGGRGVFFKCL